MKKIIKILLILTFPFALLVAIGMWILMEDESLPDLIRAYFDNVNLL